MNVIPAIDLRDGRCVRLLQGDFERETHYSDDPLAVARDYAGLGFRQLHLVDLDGARSGTQGNREPVRRLVAETRLEVQLGGGIRERDTVAEWLEAGVLRVVIGSVAVLDDRRVREWMADFGADRFVLALDCRCDSDGVPWLTTHGWTQRSDTLLWDCVDRYRDAGLRHVLCTDVSRDGAMRGPALALYGEFRRRFPALELQASGGVRDVADLAALRELGAAAAITGRALLDGCIDAGEIRSLLRDA